jgi:hypothetical protein
LRVQEELRKVLIIQTQTEAAIHTGLVAGILLLLRARQYKVRGTLLHRTDRFREDVLSWTGRDEAEGAQRVMEEFDRCQKRIRRDVSGIKDVGFLRLHVEVTQIERRVDGNQRAFVSQR